ncbi:MAG: hypothetical protein IPH30_10405 [Betaproteobacteria bacterium]|nr:hypothetical protein [Betaproteobacteria bacterium]
MALAVATIAIVAGAVYAVPTTGAVIETAGGGAGTATVTAIGAEVVAEPLLSVAFAVSV